MSAEREGVAISKGEQTRQAIIAAAYELIIQQGYAATSMRQIKERVGLALGGIYNHFSSKEDVFRAIIVERHPFFQMIPLLSSVKGDTV
jgi:AcrR family transcriptional regulator